MIPLVEEKREELTRLCERFRVERLRLFGSAACGNYRPGESDLDFVVRFTDRAPTSEYAHRLLDFAEALKLLFQCKVDLIIEQTVRNPFLQREIDRKGQPLYGRFDQKVAV